MRVVTIVGGPVRKKPGRLAAAALAVLLVSGCAQNAPGVAARVGDDAISDKQVDKLAEALCVLNAKAPAQGQGPVPTQQVRRQALQILIEIEIADGIIDPDAVDKEQLATAEQQTQAQAEALPDRLRGTFDDAVEGFFSAQLGLAALGRKSLIDKGTENPDDTAAQTEGQRLRTRYARSVGISVDPRFGTFTQGQLKPSDGSLSVPVSAQARASATADGVGATLPANLSCASG